MTTQEEHLETRITELEIELEQAQERIRQLQTDLADMTQLACDYKEANTRLENGLREIITDKALNAFGHDQNPMASRLASIAAKMLKP